MKDKFAKRQDRRKTATKVDDTFAFSFSHALDIAVLSGEGSTNAMPSGRRNRRYANEFSPFARVQLCSNFAPAIPHSAGPTPIKQIKFLPEIPTKKSQALPSSLGVLTSLVRDPCIVSTGGIPSLRRGREKRERRKERERGEVAGKRVLIEEGGNRWKTTESLGFYSQLSAGILATFYEISFSLLEERRLI